MKRTICLFLAALWLLPIAAALGGCDFQTASADRQTTGLSTEEAETEPFFSEDPYADLPYSEGLRLVLNPEGDGYDCAGIGTCTDKIIKIPPTYEGLPVVSVSGYVDSYPTDTVAMIIPEGVTMINTYAFMSVPNLQDLVLPSTITRFYPDNLGFRKLKRLVLPAELCDKFSYCPSLETVLVRGGTAIPDFSFENEDSLLTVDIGPGVTSIGSGAFELCGRLFTVRIPSSVTEIEPFAFYRCPSLFSIKVEPDNPVYHTAGDCLIETASKTLILGCAVSRIPADGRVTVIGLSAFEGYYMTDMVIPEGVTEIGESAFLSCENLTEVTLPVSLTEIGRGAFEYCRSLTTIRYAGTFEQWTSIEKGERWDDMTGAYRVICEGAATAP